MHLDKLPKIDAFDKKGIINLKIDTDGEEADVVFDLLGQLAINPYNISHLKDEAIKLNLIHDQNYPDNHISKYRIVESKLPPIEVLPKINELIEINAELFDDIVKRIPSSAETIVARSLLRIQRGY